MQIHVKMDCFAHFLHARDTQTIRQLGKSIEENALNAWKEKKESEDEIRFLQQMSENCFRFLTVTRQPDGTLLVSRKTNA